MTKKAKTTVMKMARWLAVAVAGVVLSGCYTKRVVWSSDGAVAAVLGGDGVYLANADGGISARQLEGEALFDWVPGARRLVAAQVEEVETWEALSGKLGEREREAIATEAEGVMAWLEAGGVLESVEDYAGDLRMRGAAVALCLEGQFGERIGALEEEVDLGEVSVAVTRLVELTTEGLVVREERAIGGAMLGTVADVNCSPDGKAVAVTLMGDGDEASELRVVGLAGERVPVVVDDANVAFYPDWTADGRALVYERSMGGMSGGDELGLGVLLKRQVVDGSGAIAVSDEIEELAGGLFSFYSKVRCLPDGGIIFTGMPARLPAVVRDLPQRHELFLFEPGRRATLARVLPEESLVQLPDNLAFFEMSPDGKRLVVPGEEGEVFLVEWEAGDVAVLTAEDTGDLKSVPVWRGAEELCFVREVAAEGGGGGREEVVLWRDNEERVVSDGWGEKVREGWLE